MKFVLTSAATLRQLKAMLDRVQADHLDLPLEFVHIDRGCLYTLQHVGRAASDEDTVDGDKGAFVLPNLQTPERAVILLATDADQEVGRVNRVAMAVNALSQPQTTPAKVCAGDRVSFLAIFPGEQGQSRMFGVVTEIRGEVAIVDPDQFPHSGDVLTKQFVNVQRLTRHPAGAAR